MPSRINYLSSPDLAYNLLVELISQMSIPKDKLTDIDWMVKNLKKKNPYSPHIKKAEACLKVITGSLYKTI